MAIVRASMGVDIGLRNAHPTSGRLGFFVQGVVKSWAQPRAARILVERLVEQLLRNLIQNPMQVRDGDVPLLEILGLHQQPRVRHAHFSADCVAAFLNQWARMTPGWQI